MDWDDEYDLQVAGGGLGGGPPIPAPIFHRDDNVVPQLQLQQPQPQRQRQDQDQDTPETQTPLEQLTRHWMNERHAPDILPSQEVLLASVLDHIRRQVSCFVSFRFVGCRGFGLHSLEGKKCARGQTRFPPSFCFMPAFTLSFSLLPDPHTHLTHPRNPG